jgi:hyperosmotically inducible protein
MKRLPLIATAALLAACSGPQQQNAQTNVQDGLLTTEVAAKLTGVDVDAATAVHVSVDHGVVTLSGRAHSLDERAKYDDAARSVSGVKDVRDELAVQPGFKGLRGHANDAQLTVRVSAEIAAQAGGNVFHVTPSVNDGIVTLDGTVDQMSVRETIVNSVRRISGVKAVIDNIKVRR